MPLKPLRIVAAVLGAMIGSFAVKAAFGGGGVSVGDLKKYTTAGIVAELPGPPETFEIQIPPEIRSKVASMENFQVKKGQFLAALTRVVYTPDIEASLDGALGGALTNVMKTQNMTKVSENRQPATVSGIGGLRYTAVFSKSGDEIEMNGVILAKGPRLWHVFALCKKSDTRSHEAAVRIAGSVEIATP